MAKKTTVSTAEDKLRALYDLQLIDSRIDRIRVVRGELPLEVEDLEDEIEGLRTRLERLEEEVDLVNQRISAYKLTIEESKALIIKYTEQQNNVRNNREFDSLNKEIEYQTLEIELCEKKIRECMAQAEQKAAVVITDKEKVEMRDADLVGKRSELAEIIAETKAEEDVLSGLSDSMAKGIDDRLLGSYRRIRGAAKNGLAVVPIEREASAGSYIKIPPQRQIDIAQRKRIIVDEHSGRILVDRELAEEENARIATQITKALAKVKK
ncbi:MAG: zinc ribbon domain-containing protein [Flavobacteriales bacterium]|jgi:predicted  nucleic acid-binding Zn-ribbon protein